MTNREKRMRLTRCSRCDFYNDPSILCDDVCGPQHCWRKYREVLYAAIDAGKDMGVKTWRVQMRTLGMVVADKRQELGLSQRELAKAAGVSNSTISRLEHGQMDYPTIPALQKIACTLGFDKNALVLLACGADDPSFEDVLQLVQTMIAGWTDAQCMELIQCIASGRQ